MSESNESQLYVAYYTQHPLNSSFGGQARAPQAFNADYKSHNQNNQQIAIKQYIAKGEAAGVVLDSYVENLELAKKNQRWPKLIEALEVCKKTNAHLLIAELGTHTSNESFTKPLLSSKVDFVCVDQPFVNPSTLEPLTQHLLNQRKLHGKLIREGLKLTSAKSGNPNAAEVISKVNKPKVDTAIIFAFILQHVIAVYKRKGFSQRHMVKTLNEVGFTAPEGGKWVLSQLQKVLDRIRLNDLATDLKATLEPLLAQNLSSEEIAHTLNQAGKASIKRGGWNASQVNKLIERCEQISEISAINQHILALLPLMKHLRQEGKSGYDMLTELSQEGFAIRAQKTAMSA